MLYCYLLNLQLSQLSPATRSRKTSVDTVTSRSGGQGVPWYSCLDTCCAIVKQFTSMVLINRYNFILRIIKTGHVLNYLIYKAYEQSMKLVFSWFINNSHLRYARKRPILILSQTGVMGKMCPDTSRLDTCCGIGADYISKTLILTQGTVTLFTVIFYQFYYSRTPSWSTVLSSCKQFRCTHNKLGFGFKRRCRSLIV